MKNNKHLFQLKDRVVYVTGGLGRIGKAVCGELSKLGAVVVGLDHSLPETVDRTDIHYSVFDITNTEHLEDRLLVLQKKFGPAYGWANCAYPRTEDWAQSNIENIEPQSWAENIELQMNCNCLLSAAVAKIMATRNEGSLVNIASIYGLVGPDFQIYEDNGLMTPPAYAAIKGGIIGFTRYMASHYGPRNVRINAVAPGGIAADQAARFVEKYAERTPLRRMAEAHEVGAPIAFLVSPAAAYITGTVLPIDGGWTAI